MTLSFPQKLAAAAITTVVLAGALATAQDPFGAPMPKAGQPAAGAPPGADPFGGAAVPPPAAGKAAASPAATDASKAEPLPIQVLRESNPTTPGDLLRSAHVAHQFGRPDEAKRYLGLLAAAKPADDALAPLAGPYGDFLLQ